MLNALVPPKGKPTNQKVPSVKSFKATGIGFKKKKKESILNSFFRRSFFFFFLHLTLSDDYWEILPGLKEKKKNILNRKKKKKYMNVHINLNKAGKKKEKPKEKYVDDHIRSL